MRKKHSKMTIRLNRTARAFTIAYKQANLASSAALRRGDIPRGLALKAAAIAAQTNAQIIASQIRAPKTQTRTLRAVTERLTLPRSQWKTKWLARK